VRCVPPANKPEPSEISTCRHFLSQRIASLPKVRAIVVLGRIAHDTALKALGLRIAAYPFAHGAIHALPERQLALFDSYHCSRYNTNTGTLTTQMFETVFANVRTYLDQRSSSNVD
jgi:uracil-DNA glycosylase family 4